MNDAEPARDDRVECTAARDPAVRLFILAGMMLVFGIWCFVDAFVKGKYPMPEDGNLNDAMTHYFNHVGGIVLPLAGLVPLIWAILFLRRKLVADADGIGYAGKTPLAWPAITQLDASLLQDKGIIKLHRDRGRPLVLDSWKLNNFKALVAFVERHTPDEARQAIAPPEAVGPDEDPDQPPAEPPEDSDTPRE